MMRQDQLLEFLAPYVSASRKETIDQNLESRTNYLTLVLEDIYNPHNANAVVRSCECFGVQQLHVIEERNEYQISPNVLQGSAKWIDLIRYNKPKAKNIEICYKGLKDRGYKIVATKPTPDSTSIRDIDISTPMALVFGTELGGLTDSALANADEQIYIPMFGFTESFNISVGAALTMYEILGRIRKSEIKWKLTKKIKDKLRLDWYKKSVHRIEILEAEFNRQLEMK